MITKLKKVYYCEFCHKKKGMSAGAMALHEKHCTANADRECRLCDTKRDYRALHKEHVAGKKFTTDLFDFLDDLIECPACVLTVLRLEMKGKKLDYETEIIPTYPYKARMEEWWANKNEKEMQDEPIY